MSRISKEEMIDGVVYHGVLSRAPGKPSETAFFTELEEAKEYRDLKVQEIREMDNGSTNMVSMHRAVKGDYND